MKTFTFKMDTVGRKVYQVEAETPEEATNLLIEADNNWGDKYLIESDGECWNLDAWARKSYKEKVQDCITDEWDDE